MARAGTNLLGLKPEDRLTFMQNIDCKTSTDVIILGHQKSNGQRVKGLKKCHEWKRNVRTANLGFYPQEKAQTTKIPTNEI